MTKSLAILSLLAVVSLSGCGAHQAVVRAERVTEDVTTRASQEMAAAQQKVLRSDPYSDSEVAAPWLAGKSVPLASDVLLPPVLRTNIEVTALFKGSDSVDLMTAASFLTATLRIPVRVRPDALLPQSDFMPRIQGAAAAGASKEAPKITMRVKQNMTASDLLDFVSAQTGVSWEYKQDSGSVEIYRLVTRVMEFKAAAGVSSVDIGLGRTGGQGAAFNAQSSTKLTMSEYDPVKDLKAGIEAMLTRAGTGTIGGGTVVVTDTREAVDRIANYVARENRMTGRLVRLVFEAVDVSVNDTSELGIDWDIIYKKIAQGATGDLTSGIGLVSPKKLAGEQAAALSFGVIGNSRFSGSEIALNALKDFGTIVNHTKVPMLTQNKRPVQYAVRTTFDYVSQVDVTASASAVGATTTPSIKQKEESIGTTLTITPSAFDDGNLQLALAYDATTLTSLKPYSVTGSGSSSALSTVQQRTIDGSGVVQVVPIKSGQTVLVSGFEKSTDSHDRRRLDEKAPLLFGGSDRASKKKVITLLMVTAVSVD